MPQVGVLGVAKQALSQAVEAERKASEKARGECKRLNARQQDSKDTIEVTVSFTHVCTQCTMYILYMYVCACMIVFIYAQKLSAITPPIYVYVCAGILNK